MILKQAVGCKKGLNSMNVLTTFKGKINKGKSW